MSCPPDEVMPSRTEPRSHFRHGVRHQDVDAVGHESFVARRGLPSDLWELGHTFGTVSDTRPCNCRPRPTWSMRGALGHVDHVDARQTRFMPSRTVSSTFSTRGSAD